MSRGTIFTQVLSVTHHGTDCFIMAGEYVYAHPRKARTLSMLLTAPCSTC